MDLETAEVLDEERAERHSALTWPVLLALGWLIYEVTAQPNLGAAIICAKFGWNDFRTAVWLRRTDPDARRGWACFWFYLSSALWKIAITAVVVIVAVGFLSAWRQRGQPHPSWLPSVLLTAFVGFGLSTLTTALALALAVRHGVKFWLSSSVHFYRRRNAWPPYDVYRFPFNQANRVFLTALIIVLILLFVLFLVGLASANLALDPSMVVFLVVTAVSAGLVLVLVARDVFEENFVARVPWECWRSEPTE